MPQTEKLTNSSLRIVKISFLIHKMQQKSMKLIELVTTHLQFLQMLTKLTTHPLIHPPDSAEN